VTEWIGGPAARKRSCQVWRRGRAGQWPVTPEWPGRSGPCNLAASRRSGPDGLAAPRGSGPDGLAASRRLQLAAAAVALLLAGPQPAAAQGSAEAPAEGVRVQRIALAKGDTLTVSSLGRGPVVVIVPGLLGGAFSFRHVAPELVAAGMRVVIVEPLGMGTSARPKQADYSLEAQSARIGQVLERLGVDRALLLCHSVGASICYRYALREPARVRGIVAVNGGPDEQAATAGLRKAARYSGVMRLLGGAGRARSRLQQGLVESSADPAWLTDEVLDVYSSQFRDFGAALNAIEGMAAARESQPLAPRLAQLAVPVRLLVSETGGTPAGQVELLRSIPDFEAYGIRGAGQYIQEERPRAVIDAVVSLHRLRPMTAAR
jgi:pimeloyl-ACP methyl ester carboxylesterase